MIVINYNPDLKAVELIVSQHGSVEPVRWQHQQGWRLTLIDGKLAPRIACPQCGRTAVLSGHSVLRTTGEVWPSMICPHDCGFHDYIQLLDYKEHFEQQLAQLGCGYDS